MPTVVSETVGRQKFDRLVFLPLEKDQILVKVLCVFFFSSSSCSFPVGSGGHVVAFPSLHTRDSRWPGALQPEQTVKYACWVYPTNKQKTWLSFQGSCCCTQYSKDFQDFTDEIGSNINKCDFLKYHVMNYIKIWKFSITR